jgi:ppGpp synthetase/RelA/SpoT-type nucleotidyltranferase
LETLEPFAETTFANIRDLDAEAAGLRPAQIARRNVKTIRSVVAKLRRQSTKLVQIQDLVGCRLVVPDVIDQIEWLETLQRLFPKAQVVDRRQTPQHGYRAVHVIVRSGVQRFEIQIRTRYQDEWATVVEKVADRLGLEVKYGGGPEAVRRPLLEVSASMVAQEAFEANWQVRLKNPPESGNFAMRLDEFIGPDVILYSSRRIPQDSDILIGGTDGPIEQATVDEERSVDGDWEGFTGFNYAYRRVAFQGGKAVVERFHKMREAYFNRDDEILDLMAELRALLP